MKALTVSSAALARAGGPTPGRISRTARRLAVVLVPSLAVAAAATVGGAATASAQAGEPYPVTTAVVTVDGGTRDFRARVAYPLTGRHYPAVAFGHGFLQGPERYADLLEAVAAQGFVVIAPSSETGFWPSHDRLAADLSDSLTWLLRKGHTSGSPLAGKVADLSLAVAGHSMGGGAAVLAATRDPRVRAVATLGAAETVPPASRAARDLRVPSLWVAGSADGVVPLATTRTMRDAARGPSTYAVVEGGWHCGFLGSSAYWGLGCDSGPLPREQQQATAADLLARWLGASMLGEPLDVRAVPGVTVEP